MDTQQPERRIYDTTRWRKLRRLMVQRTRYRCEECGQRHRSKWLVVHHIESVKDGCDPFDWRNLRVLCCKCHGAIHARENREHPASALRRPRMRPRTQWMQQMQQLES